MSPVFATAFHEVVLRKYNKEVEAETRQMRKRFKYLQLTYQIPEEQRQEVLQVCPHCSARLYLEGKPLLDNPAAAAPVNLQQGPSPAAAAAPAEEPAAKRARLAADCVQQLKQALDLWEQGVLQQSEFEDLKARLLAGLN